jgi:hypothetical protein
MSGDLLGGKYPLNNPLLALLGGLSNAVQGNIPARSNLEIVGGAAALSDAALAATGVGCAVPVPVDPGTVVSKVSILTAVTAGATMTNQIVALYAGTGTAPALIGQSTDTTSAAIGAKALVGWSLTVPQIITQAQAPNGFIYALVAITAATIPTAVSVATPAGINYQWNGTASPLFLSMTAGSSLAGTAAATIASPAAKVVAPIVILT